MSVTTSEPDNHHAVRPPGRRRRPLRDPVERRPRRRRRSWRTATTCRRGCHDEFDEWVKTVREPVRRPARARPRTATGTRSAASRSSSSDGVVAEVLFPNTVPPFFPNGNLTAVPAEGRRARAPLGGSEGAQPLARRLLQRHAGSPRRAGADPAARRRRRGRGDPVGQGGRPVRRRAAPGHPARQRPRAVHRRRSTSRSGARAPSSRCRSTTTPPTPGPTTGPYPATGWMFFVEAGFFSHRALWMLIFAGVFDRYPNLKLILTEGGAEWVPGVIEDPRPPVRRVMDAGDGWARSRRCARRSIGEKRAGSASAASAACRGSR